MLFSLKNYSKMDATIVTSVGMLTFKKNYASGYSTIKYLSNGKWQPQIRLFSFLQSISFMI
jgi:hypothetical protein